MELFSCPYHTSSYCLLKTGTKPGPTKDASFYVCGHCQFSAHAKLPPIHCTVHKTYTVELQSILDVKNAPEQQRHCFRCPGRNAGESWCGYVKVPKQPAKILKDRKSQNSEISDLKVNQYKVPSSKERIQVSSVIKPSMDNNKFASSPNIIDQSSSVKFERDQCEDRSITILSDNEEDQGKNVSVNDKNDDAAMEISFANLSKSRLLPASSSSESSVSFADKSFKQYRESPRPLGKSKSGQPSTKPTIISDSEESSDESDLDGSHGTRKGLEKLKISHKEDVSKPEKYLTDKSSKQLSLIEENTKELSRDTINPGKAPESRTSCSKPVTSQKSSALSISNDNVTNQDNSQEKKKPLIPQQPSAESAVVKPKVLYSTEHLKNLVYQKGKLTSELQKFQSSLRFIHIDSLPDKGQRILNKIETMQYNIQDIEKEIKKAKSELGSRDQCNNTTESIKDRAPIKDHHIVNPHLDSSQRNMNPGVRETTHQALIKSDNTRSCESADMPLTQAQQQQIVAHDFIHLPQHLQQLFAANPQAMTLYGGRMTAQKLREIGSITTEAIDKLHKQLESCPTEHTECPDPHGLKVTLKPHQRQALAWLAWREKQVPPGGILADDMGLGKTLTTISHILRHKVAKAKVDKDEWISRDKQVEKLEKAVKKSGATLIVAPASLVHQWAKEIERRCRPGLLKFIIYHGPNRERNIQKIIDNDIVLTTYTIVSKEVGSDKFENVEDPIKDDEDAEETESRNNEKTEDLPLLLKIGWERIVLDEAHNIKNHKSLTSQSACRLRAVYRWALTGTPIQNDLLDMYSLLRFLRFSPFDEYKVWKKHIDSGRGDTKRLNTIVKALLLRRTKEQSNSEGTPLVSLPSRTSQTIKVELSPEEKVVYDRLFKQTKSTVQEYVLRHAEKESLVMGGTKLVAVRQKEDSRVQSHDGVTTHGAGQSVGATNSAFKQGRSTGSKILVSLLRLRQCCSHLSLMKSHLDVANMESDGIELTLEEQLKGMLLEDIDRECSGNTSTQSSPLFHKSALSTKLKCVMEKISSIQKGEDSATRDKCVIVSQWTQMLEVVAYHLNKVGVMYRVIQGDIPAKKRMDIVDDFNTNSKGAQVLLLSLQAGGVGLNLIGGNHLFLLDIHWNPALEEQACDRIYRMGQNKSVFIYRFLCKDTIEEKIVALQETKRSLAKSVLSGEGASRQKLTLSDLRMLFGV